ADAQKMAGVLRMARQDAITSGQTSKVVFYSGSNRYKSYDSSSPLPVTYWLNKGNVILGNPNFTQKIGGNPVCAFYSSGAPSSGGTVILKNSSNQKLYVIVNPAAGRIRISDKPPDNW
ncbi:MAG: GspH/FimT family protein, partial [Syntrophomonas sp.]